MSRAVAGKAGEPQTVQAHGKATSTLVAAFDKDSSGG